MKNIKSSCCCFVKNMCEEVHVLKSECPIRRLEGQRIIRDREECTCIYISAFGTTIPKCEYYNGTKKQGKKYYISCSCDN